jgi:hypothetical protein
VQGFKVRSIAQEEDAESHAAARRAFQEFFCEENVAALVDRLGAEVARMCGALAAQAAAAPCGLATANAASAAEEIMDAVVTNVLFESALSPNLDMLHDAMMQISSSEGNPLVTPLIRHGLHPGYLRYRRKWRGTRCMWARLLEEAYARPLAPGAKAFWACLRRAYPDAQTDSDQWEHALANAGLMCAPQASDPALGAYKHRPFRPCCAWSAQPLYASCWQHGAADAAARDACSTTHAFSALGVQVRRRIGDCGQRRCCDADRARS